MIVVLRCSECGAETEADKDDLPVNCDNGHPPLPMMPTGVKP